MFEYIKNKAKELEHLIISCRRDLHKHAEAGWTEFRTSALAQSKMKSLGYTITMGKDAHSIDHIMGQPCKEELEEHQKRAISQGADPEIVKNMTGGLTGFWADMKFTDDNIFLAFRFDMDSNDITEQVDNKSKAGKEGYASINNGAMHACGHDAHVSIGLAVAEIVADMKDKLKGRIRFIFQPAEEGLRGAAPMIAAGAVKDVTHIIGMHIGFQAEKSGDLICGTKGFLASSKMDVVFTGLASHAGAYPEEGKNALIAACNATLNLHAVNRNSKGTTRINVGKLTGGEGRNVIPSSASLVMETRGLTSELNEYMIKEAKRIIEASALMSDCSYEIDIVGGTKSGESSVEMIEIIKDTAKHIPFYSNIIDIKNFGAGEDYAHMMTEVQEHGGIGTYIQVGIDKFAGHHNNKFDFDESSLIPAVELAASTAYNILKK